MSDIKNENKENTENKKLKKSTDENNETDSDFEEMLMDNFIADDEEESEGNIKTEEEDEENIKKGRVSDLMQDDLNLPPESYVEANKNRRLRKLKKLEPEKITKEDDFDKERDFLVDDNAAKPGKDDYTLEIKGPSHKSDAMDLVTSIFGDISDFIRDQPRKVEFKSEITINKNNINVPENPKKDSTGSFKSSLNKDIPDRLQHVNIERKSAQKLSIDDTEVELKLLERAFPIAERLQKSCKGVFRNFSKGEAEETILRILKLFHLEFLDVPYISMYCKDDWEKSGLKEKDIWKILKWDKEYESWANKKKKSFEIINLLPIGDLEGRKNLKTFLEERSSFANGDADLFDVVNYVNFLKNCAIEGEKRNFSEVLNLPYIPSENQQKVKTLKEKIFGAESSEKAKSEEEGEKKLKRKVDKTLFDFTLAEIRLIKKMGVSNSILKKIQLLMEGKELGEEIENAQEQEKSEKEFEGTERIEDEIISKKEFEKYVGEGKRFRNEEELLNFVSRFLAKEIALNPLVKAFCRDLFCSNAVLSTEPTQKGLRDIDWTHPFLPVKRLKDKPLKKYFEEFKENNEEDMLEQYALINEAVSEEFITKTFGFSSSSQEKHGVMEETLKSVYLNDTKKSDCKENKLRKEIISIALERHLIPHCAEHFNGLLIKKSQEYISELCAKELDEKFLYMKGFEFKKPGSTVIGISPGEFGDPLHVAVTIPSGVFVDQAVFKFFKIRGKKKRPGNVQSVEMKRKNEDIGAFKTLISENSPEFIVVGAEYVGCEKIVEDIEKLCNVSGIDARCEIIRADVANVFARSERSEKEFPGYPVGLKKAISLARLALDPLSEICYMASSAFGSGRDLFSLRLNENQHLVPQQVLYDVFRVHLSSVVNKRGVNINDGVLLRPHKNGVLEFLSGLGSNAVKIFLKKLNCAFVNSRETIKEKLKDYPIIYKNCIGFIRVNKTHDVVKTKFLDSTRIHPDLIPITKSLLSNVFKNASAGIIDDVEKLARKANKNSATMACMNFDKCSSELMKDFPNIKDLNSKVKFIASEIKNPFENKKLRDFEGLDDEELFWYSSGESKRSLRQGKIVNATVSLFVKDFVLCQVNHNLLGKIPMENMFEQSEFENKTSLVKKKIPIGITIKARITELNLEKGNFHVLLDARREALKDKETEDPSLIYYPRKLDNYLDLSEIKETKESKQTKNQGKALENGAKFTPRNIDFPFFKNFSRKEAEAYLEEKDVGSLLIRPSSRGIDYLTATWKISRDPFICVHVEIREKNKANPMSLGRSLEINKMQFEDLDEIYARFFERMTARVKEMMSFRRFRFGTEAELERLVQFEKRENTGAVPYSLGFSLKHPGHLVLFYVFSKSVKKEYVVVLPRGFKFRGKVFKSPERLITWFKKNPYSNSPYQRGHVTREFQANAV